MSTSTSTLLRKRRQRVRWSTSSRKVTWACKTTVFLLWTRSVPSWCLIFSATWSHLLLTPTWWRYQRLSTFAARIWSWRSENLSRKCTSASSASTLWTSSLIYTRASRRLFRPRYSVLNRWVSLRQEPMWRIKETLLCSWLALRRVSPRFTNCMRKLCSIARSLMISKTSSSVKLRRLFYVLRVHSHMPDFELL